MGGERRGIEDSSIKDTEEISALTERIIRDNSKLDRIGHQEKTYPEKVEPTQTSEISNPENAGTSNTSEIAELEKTQPDKIPVVIARNIAKKPDPFAPLRNISIIKREIHKKLTFPTQHTYGRFTYRRARRPSSLLAASLVVILLLFVFSLLVLEQGRLEMASSGVVLKVPALSEKNFIVSAVYNGTTTRLISPTMIKPDEPVQWILEVVKDGKVREVEYTTPAIQKTSELVFNGDEWIITIFLHTEYSGVYENLSFYEPIPSSLVREITPQLEYVFTPDTKLLITIPKLDKDMAILIEGSVSDLNAANLTLANLSLSDLNLTNLTLANLTNATPLANNTNTTNLTITSLSSSMALETEIGLLTLSASAGNITQLSLDDEMSLSFSIAGLESGQEIEATLELPYEIPEGMHVYFWKGAEVVAEEADGTEGSKIQVPYTFGESRSQIILNLQDGIIDDDGIVNGEITDPLQLFIPTTRAEVELLSEKEALISLDSSGALTQIGISSDNGAFGSISIVEPSNLPGLPLAKEQFLYQLIKFRLENLSSDHATIYLEPSELPSNPRLMKFNPQTLEWYEMPFELTDDGRIKLTIYDGGLGDDDGIMNGVIEDDLGITNNWWNTSWDWRQAINISNPTANGALSQFQVKVELSPSVFNFSKANATLSDIRFTFYNSSSNTEQKMPYFLKEEIDYSGGGETAIIWIKVPYLAAGSNTTIFAYYDNPDALSESNGTAVYEFFDDFSGSLSKWTYTDPDISIASGYLSIAGGNTNNGQNYGFAYITSEASYTGFVNGTIEGQVYPVTSSRPEVGFRTNTGANTGYKARMDSNTGRGLSFRAPPFTRTAGLLTGCTETGTAIPVGQWSDFNITITGTNFTIRLGSQVKSCTAGTYNSSGAIALMSHSTSASYFDNIIVRKYAALDPIAYYGNDEFRGSLFANITLPPEDSQYVRLSPFTTSGFFNCTRDVCGDISAYSQYYTTTSPLERWTESSFSDFSSYENAANVIVSHDIQLNPGNGGAPWWNVSWPNRQVYNISNVAGNLSSYPLRITLSSSNVGPLFNWSSDGNAMRFVWHNTTSGINQLAGYWIESWNAAGSTANVWVNIPLLANNTNTSLYMYFGNPDAQNLSSGPDTFTLFNDGSTLDGWTNSGVYVNNVTGNPAPALTIDDQDIYAYIDAGMTTNTVIEYDALTETGGVVDFFFLAGSSGQGQVFRVNSVATGPPSSRYIGFGSSSSWESARSFTNTGSVAAATWYSMVIVINSTTARATLGGTTYTRAITNSGGYVGISANMGNYEGGTVDNIRIRKNASIQPVLFNKGQENLSFIPNGQYDSSVYDTGYAEVQLENITWSGLSNSSLPITVYARSSADNISWSPWFLESNGTEMQAPSRRYVQYRLLLNTSDPMATPILESMTLNYFIVASSWTSMQSSGTIFIATNPYSCGILNQSQATCSPEWSVNPTYIGNYSVRICGNSSIADIGMVCTDTRNISVWMQSTISQFTVSIDPIGKGQNTTLQARLLDDTGTPMPGKTLNFVDQTGTGVSPYIIGEAITDAEGYASLIYSVPYNSSIGTHALNVTLPLDGANFLLQANKTAPLYVSSTPIITNVTALPSPVGFGYDVIISANITDEVGLNDLLINITEGGISDAYPLSLQSGDIYNYTYNDTWTTKTVLFTLIANNTDGIRIVSPSYSFSVEVHANLSFATGKNDYRNNEKVYINTTLPGTTNSSGLANNANIPFKGYLRMQAQRWNGVSWQNIIPPVIDYSLYEVGSYEVLNLSELWAAAGAWNTTTQAPGTYRIYAVMEDPARNILVDSEGINLEGWYSFTIVKAGLILTNLTYENLYEYGLPEYEIGDVLDWVNVSITAVNNTAFSANVSLDILDQSYNSVGWGPFETKSCGTLQEGSVCEQRFDNSSNGYIIPEDASEGEYNFYWNVSMFTQNGNASQNNSLYFAMHNIPSTLTSELSGSRIYKPGSLLYNVTFTNTWSTGMTDINMTVNCPDLPGLVCTCYPGNSQTCRLASLAGSSSYTFWFNISANESVTSSNYIANITLNYTNPTGYEKSWEEIGPETFEVRTYGIIEITPVLYPINTTRGHSYNLSMRANNTGDSPASDVWLNYTLPSGWVNISGARNAYLASLPEYGLIWNNITASVGYGSALGPNLVRIDSSASDGRNDWKILTIYVYANTTLNASTNGTYDSGAGVRWVNRDDYVRVSATLRYDNGSVISGKNISFADYTDNIPIGSAFTDANGVASFAYLVPSGASLGNHTFNATFAGQASSYLWGSLNITTINVRSRPNISSVIVSPALVGYGYNVTIIANVSDDIGVDRVLLSLNLTNSTIEAYQMSHTPPSTYTYVFQNTWYPGRYNLTIIANDTDNSISISQAYNFSVNVSARMFINTSNLTYEVNQYINLTGNSAINNSGPTNFTGYLVMKVQSNTSGIWQDVETVVDDVTSGTPRRVNTTVGLNLSGIWNPISWNTGISEAGSYRILAYLADPSGNVLYGGSSYLNYTYNFTILQPDLQLNISNIKIYDVTASAPSNRHYYTNSLVDSGINKSFTLYEDRLYRIEITIKDSGMSPWQISSTNLSYLGFDPSWIIDSGLDVWYSNQTSDDDKRFDTSFTGGAWNTGNLSWNTTQFGGSVASGKNATFFFIANLSATGSYQANLKLVHYTFVKNDYSTYTVISFDTQPPGLYNFIYNFTNSSIERGGLTKIFARWDETISQANVSYTTTSNTTWVYATNTSPQNPQNWTNFTLQSTSTWYLGVHQAKIAAKDQSNNWNNTLPYLNFTVWGRAQVTSGVLNQSTIDLGQSVRMACRVTDYTSSSSAIEGYIVSFHNSTGLLGTSSTNSSGWAVFDYTSATPGVEALVCNITENSSRYYRIDTSNYYSFSLTTRETVAPYYTTISGPTLVHRGDTSVLSVLWHDNYELGYAKLSTNASGSWSNVSIINLNSTSDYANFSYQFPTTTTLGTMGWRQYANDSFGNLNLTPIQDVEVWGWAKISSASLYPSSIKQGNITSMRCRVIDSNTSLSIASYNVSFWLMNLSTSSYDYLGSNLTGAGGFANFSFTTYELGTHYVLCNITDDSAKFYNSSETYYGADSLNVVAGDDVLAPYILGSSYQLNNTEIYKGECVEISAQWNEELNLSWAAYDPTVGNYIIKNISYPYLGNWTNLTICTNASWQPGNHSSKLYAKDLAGNTNSTAPYLYFKVWGRAKLAFAAPLGDVDRGMITLYCNVTDVDSGLGVYNYSVTFYDGDLGYSIGANFTDSSGMATLTYNFSNMDVGPDQLSCAISDSNSLYYKVYGDSIVYNTINLYGRLYPNITQPLNRTIVHRGETTRLNSTVLDEKRTFPKDESGNNASIAGAWFNSTFQQIASGNNTLWQIPSFQALGPTLIYLNLSSSYYRNGSAIANITVFGYSEVSWIYPTQIDYVADTVLNLTCLVRDNLTGGAIAGYPVEFFNNITSLGKSSTNSTGFAVRQYNTSLMTVGNNTLSCVITDNSTLYYNKSGNYSAQVIIDTTAVTEVEIVANSITFSNNSAIEGQTIRADVNISNIGSAPAGAFSVQLNISFLNTTWQHQESQTINLTLLGAQSSAILAFNWTAVPGTYNFSVYADNLGEVIEIIETNNYLSAAYTVVGWQVMYGLYNYSFLLSGGTIYQEWEGTVLEGYIYYSDIDSSYSPTDLVPLNGTNYLSLADNALGMNSFNDSLTRLYDRDSDGLPDDFVEMIVAGTTYQVPIINSTNSSTFVTGILYDSGDGATYTGANDLVFITILNQNSTGRFGTYDYEVKLPSRLGRLKGVTNMVTRLDDVY